jgi:hypothetical protein
MDEETFDMILHLVRDKLSTIHGKKTKSTKGKILLSEENLLALLFNWMREYRSMASLSMDFNTSETNIKEYIHRLVEIVHDKLQPQVFPPKKIENVVKKGILKGACLYVEFSY